MARRWPSRLSRSPFRANRSRANRRRKWRTTIDGPFRLASPSRRARTEDELDAALAQQRLSSTRRLGEILVARGALSEADVSRALAEQHELPFVELSGLRHRPCLRAALLPVDLLRRHTALPVSYLADGSVLVVVADPTSSIRDEELREPRRPCPIRGGRGSRDRDRHRVGGRGRANHGRRPPIGRSRARTRRERKRRQKGTNTRRAGTEESLMRPSTSRPESGTPSRSGQPQSTSKPRSSGMVISGRVDGVLQELGTLPDGDRVTHELTRLMGVDIAQATRPHRRNAPADLDPAELGRSWRPSSFRRCGPGRAHFPSG